MEAMIYDFLLKVKPASHRTQSAVVSYCQKGKEHRDSHHFQKPIILLWAHVEMKCYKKALDGRPDEFHQRKSWLALYILFNSKWSTIE